MAIELPAGAVDAAEASAHIGTWATVCGRVTTATYAETSNGSPTFLNMGLPHPDQDFTVVIWSDTRASYVEPPERLFAGKAVCVEGTIGEYEEVPQIQAAWAGVRFVDEWEPSLRTSSSLGCEDLPPAEADDWCWDLQAELDGIASDAAAEAMRDVQDWQDSQNYDWNASDEGDAYDP